MTVVIKFTDGYSCRLIHKLAVYPVKSRYLRQDCVIYDGDTRIALPLLDTCETCNRNYSDIRSNKKYLSENLELNRRMGHVLRICIDCTWYFKHEKGIDPPPPIRRFFNEGFKPNLI